MKTKQFIGISIQKNDWSRGNNCVNGKQPGESWSDIVIYNTKPSIIVGWDFAEHLRFLAYSGSGRTLSIRGHVKRDQSTMIFVLIVALLPQSLLMLCLIMGYLNPCLLEITSWPTTYISIIKFAPSGQLSPAPTIGVQSDSRSEDKATDWTRYFQSDAVLSGKQCPSCYIIWPWLRWFDPPSLSPSLLKQSAHESWKNDFTNVNTTRGLPKKSRSNICQRCA